MTVDVTAVTKPNLRNRWLSIVATIVVEVAYAGLGLALAVVLAFTVLRSDRKGAVVCIAIGAAILVVQVLSLFISHQSGGSGPAIQVG